MAWSDENISLDMKNYIALKCKIVNKCTDANFKKFRQDWAGLQDYDKARNIHDLLEMLETSHQLTEQNITAIKPLTDYINDQELIMQFELYEADPNRQFVLEEDSEAESTDSSDIDILSLTNDTPPASPPTSPQPTRVVRQLHVQTPPCEPVFSRMHVVPAPISTRYPVSDHEILQYIKKYLQHNLKNSWREFASAMDIPMGVIDDIEDASEWNTAKSVKRVLEAFELKSSISECAYITKLKDALEKSRCTAQRQYVVQHLETCPPSNYTMLR